MTRVEDDAAGLLARVVDPRGVDAFAASHRDDGRVSAVRVLFDSMSFEYQGDSTIALNPMQQAATFWQAPSGYSLLVGSP